MKSTSIYDYPRYYEIAFSFRNIQKELDFFDEAIRRFSRVPVQCVLELASGTSPYLEEWHRRGIRYIGLDKNPTMLSYVRERARLKRIKVRLVRADMTDFSLRRSRVDLVYVLVGSLFCKSNDEFFRHLDSVASALSKGGLYLLDWVIWLNFLSENRHEWTISRNGVTVRSSWKPEIVDAAAQVFRDRWVLRVKDGNRRLRLTSGEQSRFFFPQEFLALVSLHGKVQFLGWHSDFDFNNPPQLNGRTVVVLRRN